MQFRDMPTDAMFSKRVRIGEDRQLFTDCALPRPYRRELVWYWHMVLWILELTAQPSREQIQRQSSFRVSLLSTIIRVARILSQGRHRSNIVLRQLAGTAYDFLV